MRRGIHTKIYNQFRRERYRKGGDQEPNLTEHEQLGLKSLKKRIQEGDIVIMKTDKCGTLCCVCGNKG